jgi:hypothetical protein
MLARGLPEPKENPAAVYAFRGGSVSFVSASVLAIARRRRSPHRRRFFARCIAVAFRQLKVGLGQSP